MSILILFTLLFLNIILHFLVAKKVFDLKALYCAVSSWGFGTLAAVVYFSYRDPNIKLFSLTNAPVVLVHLGLIIAGVCLLNLILFSLSKYGRIRIARKERPRTWRTYIFALFTALLAFILGVVYFVPRWGYMTFGYITLDQLTFMLNHDLTDSSAFFDQDMLLKVVLPIIFTTIIGFGIGLCNIDIHILKRNLAKTDDSTSFRTFRFLRSSFIVLIVIGLIGSVIRAFAILPLMELTTQSYSSSDYLERNYVDPNDAKLHFPEKKRNLIHIYLESMENSYYSTDLGGHEPENLMPDLAQLTSEGVSFSHTEKLGGARETYGSGHSIAAMVTMWAGVPMLSTGGLPIPGLGTVEEDKKQYPSFTSLGDILAKQGYRNVFMLGSDSSWGDLGAYYRKHSFEVWDLNTAYKEKVVPEGYKVNWGIEDEKLYAEAKKKMTELGNSGQPFYFILENADTHFPDGYVSPDRELIYEKPYANAIYYSQKDTVELVRWIQAQPWAKDTTIVLTGDHRSMDTKFFEDWDKDYYRTVVNIFLNPVQGTNLPDDIVKNRDYGVFDIFPTLASSIGIEIEGERLGMGTNLFSGIKTIVERDGAEKINTELWKLSTFYIDNREVF